MRRIFWKQTGSDEARSVEGSGVWAFSFLDIVGMAGVPMKSPMTEQIGKSPKKITDKHLRISLLAYRSLLGLLAPYILFKKQNLQIYQAHFGERLSLLKMVSSLKKRC